MESFIPIGWLTFAKAAELYEKTWLGERPSMSPDLATQMTRLRLRAIPRMRGGESEPLTDAESKHLEDLESLARAASINADERAKNSRKLLRNSLNIGTVASVLLHRATGHRVTLPGRFWASSEATSAMAGQSCRFYLNDFWWQGPVLVFEADVIKAAAPSLPIAHAETTQTEAAPSQTLAPLQGESKQGFIVRALRMRVARKISSAEGRQLARHWLEYRKLPTDETAIEDEMKRMTAVMRTLVGPEPKQAKAKPKAKPLRSQSE